MSCNNYDSNNGYEDDDAEINFSVGRRFLTGNGVEKDVKRALELFRAAADAGHLLAKQMVETITKGMQNELENATSQNAATSSPMTENDFFALIKEKGYVEAGEKKYRAHIKLTEKGIFLANKIDGIIEEWVDCGGDGLTEEERNSFYYALDLISSNLREKIKKDNK